MLGLALATLTTASVARAQQVRTIARVIASSGVQGRFADPLCHHGRTLAPADAAAFTYAVLRAAQDPDRPMVVDAGGLLTPHGVARYAADQRPAALARMVHELGYRALTFGLNELAAPRARMLPVIEQLRERGVPMIASNLRCTPEASDLCAVLVDASDGPSIHEVADRRMAVLTVMPENALGLVAPDRVQGVTIESPADTIARLTRIARDQGADLVMVVAEAGVDGGVVSLAGALPEDARPDLILVGGQSDLLFARPRTVQPVIVGTPVDDAVELFIRESDLMRDGYEMLAQPLEGRGITVGEPVLEFIARIGGDYCEAWGNPLAGGRLDEPLDGPGMLRLAASILRDAAGADVAILNRDVLDRAWRPAQEGALTESDVYIAIEYDEPLQVAEVSSAWLTQLAQNGARNEGVLITPGLTWSGTGSDVRVGGHAVESRAGYRVVTIRFLAAGGDSLLPALPRGGRWVSLPEATLRSVVLEHLRRPREQDPRRSVDDPSGTLQWVFRASADLSFSGSSIDSPLRRCTNDTPADRCMGGLVVNEAGSTSPAYSTSLLNRTDTLTFGIALDASADASAPDWTWQNSFNLVYRTAWVETRAGQPFAEAADQIRARSALSWRGLRRGSDQWYIPDPTVDLFLESELNEPGDRSWHWFLVRPSVGVRFQLVDKLQMQLLGGLQVQPFDPAAEVEPGIGATLTLTPWDILQLGDQHARVSFTFDYFLADLGDDNRSQLRGQLDASFDLAGPLALVLSARLFVQSERGQDIGIAIDTTAALRLGYLGRIAGP